MRCLVALAAGTLAGLAGASNSSLPVDPSKIWQIGKDIYQAVKNNEPVLDLSTDWAGAVPMSITDWTTLEHWQGPAESKSFFIEFRNRLNMKLTRFEWTFVWKHSGDYQGTGKYVTQAGIRILEAFAMTTEHLNVQVTSLNPVNYGSAAQPVGGLDVSVSVTSNGLFEKTTKTCTMSVRGDGTSTLGPCESGVFPCSAEADSNNVVV